jgi:UTP--glucose-1-phosphate uridylyltransferase
MSAPVNRAIGERPEINVSASSIRRAVILANGIGAPLLPATKAVPAEMLPLVDRPLVQYAVEEALAAGIEEILILTSQGKAAIEDHFDWAPELAETLRRSGCQQAFDAVERNVVRPGVLSYIRQPEALGLGHALWCARHVIGQEPFAVLTPEDVFQAQPPCLAQMVAAYRRARGNLAAVAPRGADRRARHGAIAAAPCDDRVFSATRFAAAPTSTDPTLNWAVVGRFILEPTFIDRLRPLGAAPGAIELAAALAATAEDGTLSGYAFIGQHFDCGDTLGLFEANVAFMLARPDLGAAARNAIARHTRRIRSVARSAASRLAVSA